MSRIGEILHDAFWVMIGVVVFATVSWGRRVLSLVLDSGTDRQFTDACHEAQQKGYHRPDRP
jgi:hypothetical protein